MSRSAWTTGWCCGPTCSARSRRDAIRSSCRTVPTPRASPSRTAIRAPGTSWCETHPTCRAAPPTATRAGRWSTRRSGCRTATCACASTRRGAGRSPGYIDRLVAARDAGLLPLHRVGRRAAWSNGKVGLAGISYYAINQWQVAALQPPHLAAICIWEGVADCYRDATHHGGILCTFIDQLVRHAGEDRAARAAASAGRRAASPASWCAARRRCQRGGAGDEPLPTSAARSPRIRSMTSTTATARPDWDKITVPLLSCRQLGRPRACTCAATSKASCARPRSRNGSRCTAARHWTQFYTDYGVALQKRFFDHFLKGEDNGWDKQPPLQLQIRHPGEQVRRAARERVAAGAHASGPSSTSIRATTDARAAMRRAAPRRVELRRASATA